MSILKSERKLLLQEEIIEVPAGCVAFSQAFSQILSNTLLG